MRPFTLRYRGLVCTVALSIGLGGCSVGPNYSRPEMPAPAQYRFIEGAAQAAALANAPWWQVFDDPALQALIRDALVNNLDLQIAIARVEEARARAGVAKSFLYPAVEGVAGSAEERSRSAWRSRLAK